MSSISQPAPENPKPSITLPSPPAQTIQETPTLNRSSSPIQSEIDPVEAKRIAKIEAKIAALETQIEETQAKKKDVDAKLKTSDPQATVKAHIKLLHDYNEIRDVGQGLMSIIADNRGVRISEVYQDFDVGEGD